MRVITERDRIRSAAERWRKTYAGWLGNFPKRCASITAALAALNGDTATAADVQAIIGNDSWTRLTCDECRRSVDAVVEVGDEPDLESRTAHLCQECVCKAAGMLATVGRERQEGGA